MRAERDSRKDEAVVFVFIIATAGLLIYAAVQPWVERWVEVSTMFVLGAVGRKGYELTEGFVGCEGEEELYTRLRSWGPVMGSDVVLGA